MESASERLIKNGYDDIIIYDGFSYDSALIGVSYDGRAIYDYNLMVEWIVETQGWDVEDAVEWIDYNTLGTNVDGGPIVMFRLEDF